MNDTSFVKAGLGAAVLMAAFATPAAPTAVAPACSASLTNPTWSDCAGALFRGASDDAGNAFSLFYFDGAEAPIPSIDFSTLGVSTNPNGTGNDLSHASLYAAPPVPAIPEPQTNTLMLAGLAAIGIMALRRRLYT
jgi:PEP-CTERM motif